MPNNTSLSITGFGVISGAGHGVRETLKIFKDPQAEPVSLSDDMPILRVNSPTPIFETELKVNHLALAAVREAVTMAGLTIKDFSRLRIGVCLGSTVGCSNFQPTFSYPFNTGEFPDPSALLTHFENNTAQFISRSLGCNGPALLVTNACTSGSDAIGIAAGWLRTDLCDVVICGGAEEILPQIYHGFKSMLLCSPERCKPFDKNRSGLTLGEGCGILVLEKSTSPRPPLATFLGYSSTSDAHHPTAPHPDGKYLDVAVRNGLAQAGLDAVDFINVHGTATEHNDLAEGRWIRERAPNTAIVATKGYTGHTLAAAGAVEAVLTILSLREGILPRSFGFSEVDPRMNVAPTTVITPGDFKSALSFSLGFGGTNAVLCLGRAT